MKIAATLAASFLMFHVGAASAASRLPVSIDPTHFEITASPGQSAQTSIKFWNGSDAGLAVHVEGADFSPEGEEGDLLVDGPEAAANSLKTWLKPEYSDLTVFPKEEITIDFAVDVPPDAEPGTHWGTLLVVTQPVKMDSGAGVQTRIGPIILVKVLGDVREKMALESFTGPRLVQEPPVALAARFKNEGTVHEAPSGFIEVRDMFGDLVATGTPPANNVLPGTVRKITTSVGGGIWLGRYTATLTSSYGGQNEALPEATATFWVVPWQKYGPWALTALLAVYYLIKHRDRLPAAWHILMTGKPPPKRSGIQT